VNSVPAARSRIWSRGVAVSLALGLVGCGGSEGAGRDGSDAGPRPQTDASGPKGTSTESGQSERADAGAGASGVTETGAQAACTELAACCPLAGDLRASCELSVQVNDALHCTTTRVVLRTMGTCVEGGDIDDSDAGSRDGGVATATDVTADAGSEPNVTADAPGDAGDAPNGDSGQSTTHCENLALRAQASAETTYIGYSAANAIDGNRSTELGEASSWANDWNSPTIAFPQWFDIELDATYQVSRIELYTTDDYRISEYDYAYWGGSDWVQLGQVTGNTGVRVVHEFQAVETSAIRIVVRRGPEHQFIHARLNEVEIYGAWTEACH
jgi:F5/8 type C domain